MTASQIPVALVVAAARNRVIGRNNQLPWHLPAELAHFKRITLGKPIIMGRNTFESIGRPLPGRTNIVVTRNPSWVADGVVTCHSLAAAVAHGRDQARADGMAEVLVIGGAQLYREALSLAQKIYMTEVACEPEGDAWFPSLAPDDWLEVHRTHHRPDDKNSLEYAIVELLRREP